MDHPQFLSTVLVTPGSDPSASLDGGQHVGRSLVIDHDPGVASKIVRELCQADHRNPSLPTMWRETLGLVHDLAAKL